MPDDTLSAWSDYSVHNGSSKTLPLSFLLTNRIMLCCLAVGGTTSVYRWRSVLRNVLIVIRPQACLLMLFRTEAWAYSRRCWGTSTMPRVTSVNVIVFGITPSSTLKYQRGRPSNTGCDPLSRLARNLPKVLHWRNVDSERRVETGSPACARSLACPLESSCEILDTRIRTIRLSPVPHGKTMVPCVLSRWLVIRTIYCLSSTRADCTIGSGTPGLLHPLRVCVSILAPLGN